jgi:hypothetical protein
MVPCNTLHLCKSCIVKYLTGHRDNFNKENHYPKDDTDIFGDDRFSTSKTCISCG